MTACSSPASYSGLAPGRHTFRVRAVDRAGNVDPSPAERSWSVAAAPTTSRRTTRVGTAGPDVLRGTAGLDLLRGRGGNDVLLGLGGADILLGGTGRDRLLGGAGTDVLRATDGHRDRVFCGGGRDTAFADRLDRVAADCERVVRLRNR
jgi:Ca2+-binding RTX toxin-like protein